MNRTFLLAVLAVSPIAVTAFPTRPPLIVVDDRGGPSPLPYYEALNPQPEAAVPLPTRASPRVVTAADAEARMLPIRSLRLSSGTEPRRTIQAPGLAPLFLIGDDDRSRVWLQRRHAALRDLGAVGLVVNVASPDALAALRRLAPGVVLSPVSGDELAQRLGIRHYPVLVTATGIEP